MKMVVTGGAGFIGSNIVKNLNEQDIDNIIIVDHLTDNGKWKNLIDLRFQDYFDRDDFLELVKTNKLKKIDAIVHIGACSSTTELDENYLLYNNTKYSKVLFDYCITNNIRFLYASSGSTYGDGSLGYSDKTRVLNPLNGYGYSKYLFDQWVFNSKKKPPQWVGLKFFNVYGPNEYHKGQMASVVWHGFNQIKTSGKIKLFRSHNKNYKDGEQKRDFVYVKNVVDVVDFFLKHPAKNGLFNVGSGQSQTFLDLAKGLFKAMHKKPLIEFIPMPQSLRSKYQYFTEADITSLRKVGYKKSFMNLESGIKDYVENHLLTV